MEQVAQKSTERPGYANLTDGLINYFIFLFLDKFHNFRRKKIFPNAFFFIDFNLLEQKLFNNLAVGDMLDVVNILERTHIPIDTV